MRVNKLVPREVWEKRYDHINDFERLLADSGTRILKFYLHISKDEQKERFQERLDARTSGGNSRSDDLADAREVGRLHGSLRSASLTRCNTEYAPWYIVPANHKWYRDLVITRAIVETLEDMKVAYPKPTEDLSGIKIPD